MKRKNEIICIIDKSGSMQTTLKDVIGGFNTFITEQKKLSKSTLFSLLFFDAPVQHKMFYDGVKIDDVKSLDESTYIPGGMTALNDAIGFVIDTVEKRHSTLKTKPNTMLVILTDGQENSSAEYTLEQIKNQIEKVKKDGWEVLYIGASVDAFTQDQMRNYSGHIQTMYLGCRTIEASFANLNSHVTNYIKDKKDKK